MAHLCCVGVGRLGLVVDLHAPEDVAVAARGPGHLAAGGRGFDGHVALAQ